MGKRKRGLRDIILGATLAIAAVFLGIPTWGVAEEAGSTAPINIKTETFTGTVTRAHELQEGYYVILKQGERPIVLTVTPESEISIAGQRRTPDEFLRLVQVGKDQATAVFFENAEGMMQVLSISVEPAP